MPKSKGKRPYRKHPRATPQRRYIVHQPLRQVDVYEVYATSKKEALELHFKGLSHQLESHSGDTKSGYAEIAEVGPPLKKGHDE